MSLLKSNRPLLFAPKSIFIERCKQAILAGRREESSGILFQLSQSCHEESELEIIRILKARHKKRFHGISEIPPVSGDPMCGSIFTIDVSNETSFHGGIRTKCNTSNDSNRFTVTIITINRNCAEGLKKTIKSVISQKAEMPGIEHIVIDGASTDNSLEIIREYADQIDYFISEPDGGIYAAMNKGIRLAQGDYISFLNADDIYRRGATRLSVENIRKNNVDISYGAFAYINPDGYNEVVDGPRDWDEALLIRGIPGGHGTFFVSKEAYNKVGGYREDLRIVSDYDWMIRAYLAGCTASPLRDIIHEMTQGGISFNGTLEKSENCRLFTEYLGENDESRLELLYSLKYYRNWDGHAISQKEQLKLLEMAETIQDFEPTYAKALVKTVSKSAQKYVGVHLPPTLSANNKQLSVCVAVTYLNSIAGGAERIAIEAANRMAEDGHAVTIVCCHGLAGEPFYRVDDRVTYLDLANKPLSNKLHAIGLQDWTKSWQDVLESADKNDVSDLKSWLNGPNQWKTLVYNGFFKSNSFDVVISHMPSTYPYIALAMAGLAEKPKHIAALHNSPSYKFYSPLYSANSDSEKRVWLSTLGMCDHISVLFTEFISELPEKFRSKAFVLPNFIESGFSSASSPERSHEKTKKIVTIGRLAPQKNQRALIDAFASIRKQIPGWTLEIYGEGPLRDELADHCTAKGLEPESILRGRTESPRDVYDAADIFVFPSHFEGFGLALVEAMARGLPVIGFQDCPGVKFIVENEVNGLLVEKDEEAMALANAILKLASDEQLRKALASQAISSSKQYNLNGHVSQLYRTFETTAKPQVSIQKGRAALGNNLNVAIMCTNPAGGAGIAAVRLQDGLHKIGVAAAVFSSAKGSVDPAFVLKAAEREPELNPEHWRISNGSNLRYPGGTIFSSELGTLSRASLKPALPYDIINLHWISHFLSPTSVSWLIESGKPVVWTLHDMLPFTGGCHYTSGCTNFTTNCENCPQVINNYENHPRDVLETKRRLWQDKITVISPSVWLADEARKSRIFRNSRIEVVPNGIDTLQYQPWDKQQARKKLNLPLDKKIILFACHSHAERRKGFQEALMMLISLNRHRNDLHLVTLGRSSDETSDLSIPNTVFGFISSSKDLSMIYSACDVTVLPSLEDNLPNTILESFACGTPIAGFRAGGIVDLVDDGITGYLAPLKDILGLRDAVEKCIDSNLGQTCRDYAVRNLDFTKQATAYAQIFHSLATK